MSVALARVDHGHPDTVFDRAHRIKSLQLGQYSRSRTDEFVDFYKWGIAYCSGDIFVNMAHVISF